LVPASLEEGQVAVALFGNLGALSLHTSARALGLKIDRLESSGRGVGAVAEDVHRRRSPDLPRTPGLS